MSNTQKSPEDVQAGLNLRIQALALLNQAHALDGLRPFLGIHSHRHGEDEQFMWAPEAPSQEELKVVFREGYESGRNESLESEAIRDLDVLVGVAPEARLADILQAASDEQENDAEVALHLQAESQIG
jgi:hypothetical protein